MDLIVKAKNIDLEYNGRQILNIDNLEIYNYDKIGIVGKNGSGKTTLLKVLLGQIELKTVMKGAGPILQRINGLPFF